LLAAVDILSLMAGPGERSDVQHSLLVEACKRILTAAPDSRSLARAVEALQAVTGENRVAAKRMADTIETYIDHPVGRLFFAKRQLPQLFEASRLAAFQIPQIWDLPEPTVDVTTYTIEQRLRVLATQRLNEMVLAAVLADNRWSDLLYSIETWKYTSGPVGNFFEQLARTGRRSNTVTILDTQVAIDVVGSPMAKQIGMIFAFGNDNEDEAKAILRLLGMEVNRQNVQRVQKLETGHCFFRIRTGEVGVLYVEDDHDPDWKEFTNTKPEDRRLVAAESEAR
jgi:hypothetical protein